MKCVNKEIQTGTPPPRPNNLKSDLIQCQTKYIKFIFKPPISAKSISVTANPLGEQTSKKPKQKKARLVMLSRFIMFVKL